MINFKNLNYTLYLIDSFIHPIELRSHPNFQKTEEQLLTHSYGIESRSYDLFKIKGDEQVHFCQCSQILENNVVLSILKITYEDAKELIGGQDYYVKKDVENKFIRQMTLTARKEFDKLESVFKRFPKSVVNDGQKYSLILSINDGNRFGVVDESFIADFESEFNGNYNYMGSGAFSILPMYDDLPYANSFIFLNLDKHLRELRSSFHIDNRLFHLIDQNFSYYYLRDYSGSVTEYFEKQFYKIQSFDLEIEPQKIKNRIRLFNSFESSLNQFLNSQLAVRMKTDENWKRFFYEWEKVSSQYATNVNMRGVDFDTLLNGWKISEGTIARVLNILKKRIDSERRELHQIYLIQLNSTYNTKVLSIFRLIFVVLSILLFLVIIISMVSWHHVK